MNIKQIKNVLFDEHIPTIFIRGIPNLLVLYIQSIVIIILNLLYNLIDSFL